MAELRAALGDAGTLVLADAAALPAPPELRALLDRIGVLAAGAAGDEAVLPVELGGTAMAVRRGAAPLPSLPIQAIGGVVAGPADDARSLTLSLRQPPTDPAGYVAAVQRLCVLAAMVGELVEAERLYWSPAGLWSPVAALADAVAAGQEDGVPPVMHLIAFMRAGEGEVVTRGLAFFAGTELMLTGAGDMAFTEQVRRLARLAVHAMLVGPMQTGASVPGLTRRETITVDRTIMRGGTPVTIIVIEAR